MRHTNKVLIQSMSISKSIVLIISLFLIATFEACSSSAPPLSASDFSEATVYFHKFDSSTPAALDEKTLRRAYDVSYVLKRKEDIDQLYSFFSRMKCDSAPEVIDDLRVLVEFRNNSGSHSKWRSSFFSYVDFQGDICHLHDSEREEIESLLLHLESRDKKKHQ